MYLQKHSRQATQVLSCQVEHPFEHKQVFSHVAWEVGRISSELTETLIPFSSIDRIASDLLPSETNEFEIGQTVKVRDCGFETF